MKKLLVVMVVLGMGLPAGAALLVDGRVEWDVVGDQLIGTGTRVGPYFAMLSVPDFSDPAALIVPAPIHDVCAAVVIPGYCKPGVTPEAGDEGRVEKIDDVAWDVVAGDLGPGIPETQVPGVWFVFDIVGEGDIVLSDAAFAPVGTIHVPEPVSLGLLGLGGLFLRRRKLI